ncbi:MAG TPA: aminodeoxychorismate synthase component I, partial [Armatimonadota bacterium]|nr:aminodeoxychorismate synthase component I [Armatimonadota bacterium]
MPLLYFAFPSAEGTVTPRLFRNPEAVFEARRVEDVAPALRAVQEGVNRGLWAAGYIAYDAAPAFDPAYLIPGVCEIPLLWLGLFNEPLAEPLPGFAEACIVSAWEPDISQQEYNRSVKAIRSAIGRGDTYQVNYTFRLRAHFSGSDVALFQRLCAAQPGGYSAYLNLGRYRILSASPELFFRWDGDHLLTRPMKGTAPRGRWRDEDDEHAAWLQASAKNRAENTTIVDLLRNDLSRIARPGAVRVPSLWDVERYRTLLQMTSTITAETEPGTELPDLFQALFPCGSITGAPRISTMDLIARHESSARQVYCGAIGMIAPGNHAVFNVAIRTVLVDAGAGLAEYGIGGGITWDSAAGDEYDEALLKAQILLDESPSFELLETLALEDGDYRLLQRHLDRLSDSAAYFDIPVDRAAVQCALDETAAAHDNGAWRVRLLVSQAGVPHVEAAPLTASGPTPGAVRLALSPVDSGDRFLYHKTTHREVYDRLRSEADPDHTHFDVLLWNERGELTEFTTGNLVFEMDG